MARVLARSKGIGDDMARYIITTIHDNNDKRIGLSSTDNSIGDMLDTLRRAERDRVGHNVSRSSMFRTLVLKAYNDYLNGLDRA